MKVENINILADYDAIFSDGKTSPEEVFTDSVPTETFVALSIFSWKNDCKIINSLFLENINPEPKVAEVVKQRILIKRPNNLMLWYFLLPGCRRVFSWSGLRKFEGIEDLTRGLLMANKRESEIENNNGYSLNNPLHFYRDNSSKQFHRAISIYINNKEMSSYSSEFKDFYGVEIAHYLAVVHFLSIHYNQMHEQGLFNNWAVTVDDIAGYLSIPAAVVGDIIRLISLPAFGFKNIEFKSISESEVKLFSNTPYLMLADDKYVPADGKLAENLTFYNLFYKVKRAARNKNQFMRDYGRAFETYVAGMVNKACQEKGPINYQFIEEFEFGQPQVRRSSDAYISFYDPMIKKEIVIVFEVKSARILDSVKKESPTEADISKSLDKTILSPLIQMLKVTSEIIDGDHHDIINKDKIYFFVSVSTESFPILLGTDNRTVELNATISKNLKVGDLISLNIEEFEIFMSVMMSKTRYPLSLLIHQFHHSNKVWSFKTYLNRFINDHQLDCREYHSQATRTLQHFMRQYLK